MEKESLYRTGSMMFVALEENEKQCALLKRQLRNWIAINSYYLTDGQLGQKKARSLNGGST